MLWGTHFFNQGVITSPLIRDAMDAVKREDFVPPDKRYLADEDHPIEIGFGQTNSQPYTVAFMLELLDPQPGQKVLDIGSGSGWTSMMLAFIVSHVWARLIAPLPTARKSGTVFAVERIPELVEFGRANAKKYHFTDSGILQFIHSDGSLGLPEHAPFDRILVSAAFKTFPEALIDQLSSDNGILVVPVEIPERGIMKVVRHAEKVAKQWFPGFVFVPMISES